MIATVALTMIYPMLFVPSHRVGFAESKDERPMPVRANGRVFWSCAIKAMKNVSVISSHEKNVVDRDRALAVGLRVRTVDWYVRQSVVSPSISRAGSKGPVVSHRLRTGAPA